jgi:alpha-mannosidase
MSLTIHLIANAHLDPVWLWDAREGMNEALRTVRSVLALMDEYPELTFTRGESLVYEHVQRHDPEAFARIRQHVENGRWDVVGGNYLQPDHNLPTLETLRRLYRRGQTYFAHTFGRPVEIGWAADAFGHSAGLAELLMDEGFSGFAFGRPEQDKLPLAEPAFWWRGASGRELLTYRTPVGWYGCESSELRRRLDQALELSGRSRLSHIAVYYGLGDHGGGPCRRMLDDIRAWTASHPQVRVIHSGLHRFFAALRLEIDCLGHEAVPTHEGELNFCFRGAYSSASAFKFAFREAEAALQQAEAIDAGVAALVDRPPVDLSTQWDALLFNTFHDILPGTSIARAMHEQMQQVHGITAAARQVSFEALTALSSRIDTRVRPPADRHRPEGLSLLAFNPLPVPYVGPLEFEVSLDYRPLFGYEHRAAEVPVALLDGAGRAMPFQRLATEHACFPHWPWRARLLAPVELLGMGWAVLEAAWDEEHGVRGGATGPAAAGAAAGDIENACYRVAAGCGDAGVSVLWQGRPALGAGGLQVVALEDPLGCWGASTGEDDRGAVVETWPIEAVARLEAGPLRRALWVRLGNGRSWVELTLRLWRDEPWLDVQIRSLLVERGRRIKLVLPIGAEDAVYEVPGGQVRRRGAGDVPVTGAVRAQTAAGEVLFATNGPYAMDVLDGALRPTLGRCAPYASDVRGILTGTPWREAMDHGVMRCRAVLSHDPKAARVYALAQHRPPLALLVASHAGRLGRVGSIAASPG